MDDTLSGCDWCPECGGGLTRYQALLDELRDLEGHYLRICEGRTSIKYDFRQPNVSRRMKVTRNLKKIASRFPDADRTRTIDWPN